MNQHLRAVGVVAAMLAISISTVVGIRLAFEYFTPSMIPFVFGATGIGICLYALYSIALAKIQYDDALKEMVDRK